MNTDYYYIGIDGGGTHCRARLEDASGQLLSTGLSGSANVMRSLAISQSSIIEAVEDALSNTNRQIRLDQLCVSAGLAGANVPSAHKAITQWQHPFHAFSVISDLHAACMGAHQGQEGAVIICGTGSSGTRFSTGEFEDFGGHGFLIGDMASGAWLGLQAIQHTLQVLDGILPLDTLTVAVKDHLNVDDAISLVQIISDYRPKHFAALAPIVINQVQTGDPKANAILNQAIAYLQALAERLLEGNHYHLAMIGGLADIYLPRLPESLQSRIRPCISSPEQGAILFFKQSQRIQENQK